MSKLHINRDRQNLGQFTPEQVSEGLAEGRFLPTDLAWREGMDTWQPLSTFADLPAATPSEEEPHPSSQPAAPQPPAETGLALPSWERYAELGVFKALLATIREVYTQPAPTFGGMKKTGGFQGPLVFSLVLGFACGLAGVLESLALARVVPGHLLAAGYEKGASLMQLVVAIPSMLIAGILAPFVFSGIYFVMIRLITKKTVAYETVFRAYCYVVGALSILNLVPVPPIPLAQITFAIFVLAIALPYQVIAMREAGELTTLEAVGVVLLPGVIFCFCCLAAAGAILALAGGVPGLQNLGR